MTAERAALVDNIVSPNLVVLIVLPRSAFNND
jgi:hypothetical protein